MYDTIAAMIEVDLEPELFSGGQIMSDFNSGQEWSRLWRNSRDEYEPRFTYWPAGRVLKVEVSLPKLVNERGNLSEAAKESALDALNDVIGDAFGALADVRTWRCQRVDYVWMWQVDEPAWYIATYGRADLAGTSRQEYPTGVVWKLKQRWTKLYDKSAERGDGDGWLRLEVSNYAKSVSYMCERWFGCEQTVREVLRPGRALYVLAREFERLNMHMSVVSDAGLVRRMRGSFGASVSGAWYALSVMRMFGRKCVALGLLSNGSYYDWRKRLADGGFLVVVGDDVMESGGEDVERLRLPVREVVENGKNLEGHSPAQDVGASKIAPESDAEAVLEQRLGLIVSPGSFLMLEFLEMGRAAALLLPS